MMLFEQSKKVTKQTEAGKISMKGKARVQQDRISRRHCEIASGKPHKTI